MADSRELQSAPEVVYPESDGQPMAETEQHFDLMLSIAPLLRRWFRSRPEVHVAGNQFVHHEEGNPRAVLCPDTYVAFGVGPGARRTWKTWEEGCFPQVIFELLSDDTWRRDLGAKREIYEAQGVEESFCFDPFEERRGARLHGWRRAGDRLVPIEPELGAGALRLRSEALGLLLQVDGAWIRFFDARTGELVPYPAELLEAEEAARETEQAARHRAEAESARLAAEVERLRSELERARRGDGRS